jgi:7-carboxy-7-deazaguanine synthase
MRAEMRINEIFHSIQGEGRLTGLPTIFIRTTGCNLRCSYCDTTYAYEEGVTMTIAEILSNVKEYDCQDVCITGGEPLLQKDMPELLHILVEKGYHCSIETNGSQDISFLKHRSHLMISLDLKCPSSGMHTMMKQTNLSELSSIDQLKCIIKTKVDYDYAKSIITTHDIACPIFFQPVWGSSPTKLAEWILTDGLRVHLGLQMHKILWSDRKGV